MTTKGAPIAKITDAGESKTHLWSVLPANIPTVLIAGRRKDGYGTDAAVLL